MKFTAMKFTPMKFTARKFTTMKFTAMNLPLKQSVSRLLICVGLLMPVSSLALEEPDVLIETTVQSLLDEFTSRRDALEADKRELFALVDRVAAPLFDLKRISKLVLANHWKQASPQQREEFTEEFKKLLIGTYATALFKYTGNEKITFTGSEITERKGRKSAEVKSEVTLSGRPPILVDYWLLLGKDERWRIYNLEVSGLNMVTSYRNTYAAAIGGLGLDGVIESMKQANAKNL